LIDESFPPFRDAMRRAERNYLARALLMHLYNVRGTAKAIRIPLSTLKYKMQVHGLRRPERIAVRSV
jgi:DNA-binding NtrC family response regulator